MKRVVIICLLLIFGLTTQPIFSIQSALAKTNQEEITELNQKIAERKDKIKTLEDSIAKYKKNIEQKQLEAVSLRNQLDIIENHIARIKADVDLTDEKIAKTELEIKALTIEINDRQKNIDRQKQIIAKMLRNVNQEQNKNYLEILLTNDSFSDFYNQLQYLENIYQDLGQTTQSLRLIKEELEKKKILSEKYKKDQEDLKTKLAIQKQDYVGQSDYKTNLLAQTKWSEWTYQTLVANLKKQYQQIENEVSTYEREVQRKLAAQDDKLPSGDVAISWPTASHYITAYFHDPEYPYRHVFEHSGIDIAISHGTPLRAAAAGYVARAKTCYNASCYSYVLLVHTGSLSTLYGHISNINVSADQFVNKGDIIGYSGGTPGTVGAGPFVTGPHLHFEVRLNGIPVDPLGYLK